MFVSKKICSSTVIILLTKDKLSRYLFYKCIIMLLLFTSYNNGSHNMGDHSILMMTQISEICRIKYINTQFYWIKKFNHSKYFGPSNILMRWMFTCTIYYTCCVIGWHVLEIFIYCEGKNVKAWMKCSNAFWFRLIWYLNTSIINISQKTLQSRR